MAEIPDDKFKSEVMKFIEVANQKFDGLTSDLRTNTFKLDSLENGLNRVEEKVDRLEVDLKTVASDVKVLSGQFQDVALMTMKDHSRIDNLEKRVDDLESGIH
jgi:chromosome segregation ATPase